MCAGGANEDRAARPVRRDRNDDPTAREAMQAQITELDRFLTLVAAEPATTQPPPPARVVPLLPPSIALNCGTPVTGSWDWYQVNYGYRYNSYVPIVEWAIDYGDGRNYAANDEPTAIKDAYWHRYQSPGTYQVNASVTDVNGLVAHASCVFQWNGNGGNQVSDSGDLDCEDIGEEVYIDDEDPNNLDADGDGIGCEGW